MNWTKHYVDAHIVNYEGRKLDRQRMEGSWSLSVDSHGDWCRGAFVLKRTEENEENAASAPGRHHQVDWLYQSALLNRLRTWTGFYEQFGKQYGMTTSLVFTSSGRIHGKGVDTVGHYTWCGNFRSTKYGERKEVNLIKQYFEEHAVSYEGHIEERPQSGVLVMTGTWTISATYQCNGKFELQSTSY
ncbi:hypothetical protein L7F22_037532 [Adiantum nelumboides]|nr:hypothetical protein [Adiantum nelumboides]